MRYIKATLKRILDAVELSEVFICAAGLTITTLLIFVQVLNRRWLHFEIMGLGDLAQYGFIFFMLIAAALTVCREGHIAVDYFYQRAFKRKPRGIAIHRVFILIISIAAIGAFLPQTYKFMLRALEYPEWGTLITWFNQSWLQVTLFFAAALMLVHLLVLARRDISELIKNWNPNRRRQ